MSGKALNYKSTRRQNNMHEEMTCEQEQTYSDKRNEAIMIKAMLDTAGEGSNHAATAVIHTGIMIDALHHKALCNDD